MQLDAKRGIITSHDIYLNGRLLEDVAFADDETQVAEVFERHWSTGELLPDPEHPRGLSTLTLTGKVEIRPREGQSYAPPSGALIERMTLEQALPFPTGTVCRERLERPLEGPGAGRAGPPPNRNTGTLFSEIWHRGIGGVYRPDLEEMTPPRFWEAYSPCLKELELAVAQPLPVEHQLELRTRTADPPLSLSVDHIFWQGEWDMAMVLPVARAGQPEGRLVLVLRGAKEDRYEGMYLALAVDDPTAHSRWIPAEPGPPTRHVTVKPLARHPAPAPPDSNWYTALQLTRQFLKDP